jgi:anti-anti-sigma factor
MSITTKIKAMDDRGIIMLTVQGELDWDSRQEFQQATTELLGNPHDKAVIDLSGIQKMSSLFIGTLTDCARIARESNKHLSVIMDKRIAAVCRTAGLEKVLSIIDR